MRYHEMSMGYHGRASGVALLLAAVAMSGCKATPPVRQLTADVTEVRGGWSEVFVEKKIDLQRPPSGPVLSRVGQIVVDSTGHLLIPDGRGKRVLVFDGQGRLVREIQGGHSSFTLSILHSIALDYDNNLLVFDPDGNWVTVLSSPTYKVLRRFQLSGPVANFLVLRDGAVVTYFPAAELAFKKFDRDGREVAAAYRVRDENLRIFHGRVQTGGITQVAAGDLFGLHPSTFELVRLSPDLQVLELIRGSSDEEWAPEPAAFPAGLNPYDYRLAHEEWWDSFVHIGRPYALTGDLVLVTLFASRGLAQTEDFANIYRTTGGVVARGLRVPHGARVVGVGHGRVYAVRNAQIRDDGQSIEPLELYEYQLRDAQDSLEGELRSAPAIQSARRAN